MVYNALRQGATLLTCRIGHREASMMLEQTLIRPFVITFAVVSGSCGEETDGIDFTELAKVAEYYELPLLQRKRR